ncbi:hypothetical protein HPNQ4053_0978 [Helicobacter pylori NQ4053]|uniref:Uncharacterized protein n=1 Tax=Helicobacter pylori NQ4053 TaxID=992027 RepID=I9QLD0_HELPX|nr:hypothetical protein HPNQ4053_0978 [Helicobacter pylori NQ4053]
MNFLYSSSVLVSIFSKIGSNRSNSPPNPKKPFNSSSFTPNSFGFKAHFLLHLTLNHCAQFLILRNKFCKESIDVYRKQNDFQS